MKSEKYCHLNHHKSVKENNSKSPVLFLKLVWFKDRHETGLSHLRITVSDFSSAHVFPVKTYYQKKPNRTR